MLDFEPYALDIETTDLAGSGEVIGWTLYNILDGQYHQEFRSAGGECHDMDDMAPVSEPCLLELLSGTLASLRLKLGTKLRLVTYNGESYKGGFDLPFLRRRYIIHRLQERWRFKGILHLDLLPIVQTRLNTMYRMPVCVEMLDSAQLGELISCCGGRPGKTRSATIELVKAYGVDKPEVTGYLARLEPLLKTDNSLDTVYSMLNGPPLGCEHIDGSKVPGIWKKYVETGDEKLRQELVRYNLSDCKQIAHVFKLLYPLLSDDVEREWRRL